MSSKRCPQCGLVNFADAEECKRCNLALNELSSISARRKVNAPEREFYANELPPPPPVFDKSQRSPQTSRGRFSSCAKCGSGTAVSFQTVKKSYLPPAVYLMLLLGPIPFVVAAAVARVRHQISVPFCQICWDEYRPFTVLSPILQLVMASSLIFAIVLGISFGSHWIAIVLIVICIATGGYHFFLDKKVNLKFGKVNGNTVAIKLSNGIERDFLNV